MDLHRKYCPWCGTENVQATESAPITKKLDSSSSIDEWSDAGWAYDSAAATDEADEAESSPSLRLPGRSITPIPQEVSPPRPPTPSIGHTFRLWLRPLSLTLLIVLIAFIAFITLGIYEGINDRQVQNKVQAIEEFNEGRSKMDEGEYQLAIAYFREALRLEPNFEAAAQFLDIAEQNAEIVQINAQSMQNTPEPPTPIPESSANDNDQTTKVVPPTVIEPSPTPIEVSGSVFDPDKLFDEAKTLFENEDWQLTVATLDGLKSQAPDYRSEEVAKYLASALMNQGNIALEEQKLEDALTYFEQAVIAEPDNEEVQKLRTLTASYLNGQRAYDKQQWDTATKQLRKVYVLEPGFLETDELLAQAHFELGEQFAKRAIWCQAVEQYRSSLLVKESQEISDLADESDRKCSDETIAVVVSTQTTKPLTGTAGIVTKTAATKTVVTRTKTPLASMTKTAPAATITSVPTRQTPTRTSTPTNDRTPTRTSTPINNSTPTSIPTSTSIPTVTPIPGANETATIAAYYETATIEAYYATATQDTVNYYATVTAQAFDIYATVTAEAALGTATPIPPEPTVPPLDPPTSTPEPVPPTLTIGPTPISSGLGKTPTAEPTEEGSSGGGFSIASVSQSTDSTCNGQYIQGAITLPNGAPVPGISVIATDLYGNVFQGTSKPDGLYDIPISHEPNSFTVRIIDGPDVTIKHEPQGTPLCHVINWLLNQ